MANKAGRGVLTAVVGTIGFVGTIIGILAAADQLGFLQISPHAPGAHPPSMVERAAWNDLPRAQNACQALRDFISKYPDGAYAQQAQSLLATRTEISAPAWAPITEPSVVTGSSNLSERANEAVACQSAKDSATRNAETGCSLYSSDAQRFRNIQTVMSDMSCECRDYAMHVDGAADAAIEPIWRCTVHAPYQCRGEYLEQRQQESCSLTPGRS